MYNDGYKTLSHKKLIEYIEKKDFDRSEIILMDEARKLRNDILYYGKKISSEFLENKETKLKSIIKKLLNHKL